MRVRANGDEDTRQKVITELPTPSFAALSHLEWRCGDGQSSPSAGIFPTS
jgi:hypothetical protein